MVTSTMLTLTVDGVPVTGASGATVLEACDRAGHYVPRLCSAPGSSCCTRCCSCAGSAEAAADGTPGSGPAVSEPGDLGQAPPSPAPGPPPCGLCAVRLADGETVLACATVVGVGMEVTTDDPGLRALRLERLAPLLARHPHICLTCPDRDGCARDECRFGVPLEARCCDQFGHCEFGRLVSYVDPEERVARRAVAAPRDASIEGRIRREPGLCVGCGRCVTICSTSPDAGDALEMRQAADAVVPRGIAARGIMGPPVTPGLVTPGPITPGPMIAAEPAGAPAWVASPREDTLRASGCTLCGQCVLVCPAGALTVSPGPQGQAWLEGRRKRYPALAPVLPPDPWLPLDAGSLAAVPAVAGVFQVAEPDGRVVRIAGVADLREGLAEVLAGKTAAAGGSEAAAAGGLRFRFEPAPLYTERESELLARFAQEHGHLPPGNDLADDLFDDDLL